MIGVWRTIEEHNVFHCPYMKMMKKPTSENRQWQWQNVNKFYDQNDGKSNGITLWDMSNQFEEKNMITLNNNNYWHKLSLPLFRFYRRKNISKIRIFLPKKKTKSSRIKNRNSKIFLQCFCLYWRFPQQFFHIKIFWFESKSHTQKSFSWLKFLYHCYFNTFVIPGTKLDFFFSQQSK